MNKDEMKNKISMALKDTILQHGFELICKENAELKLKLDALEGQIPWKDIKNKSEVIGKLTKAKELIKELISSLSVVGECEEEECELLNRAEQFIGEVEK